MPTIESLSFKTFRVVKVAVAMSACGLIFPSLCQGQACPSELGLEINQIAPTLGTVPPCVGGQGGSCIKQPSSQNAPQAGGMSVYPQNTPSGPYTEAWTAPLCNPITYFCFNPLACVSAAFKVIGQ
jgi:hypothetical protein